MKKAHDYDVFGQYAPPEDYLVLQQAPEKADAYAYRDADSPLEAFLEHELGFQFYDTVLTADEIKRWEDAYGEPFVCKLRQICRSVVRAKRTLVISCNGSGKTYLFGRIAACYPLLFPPEPEKEDYAAVWVGCAPPKDNLYKIFSHVENTRLGHPHLFRDFTSSDKKLLHRTNGHVGVRGQPFPQSGTEQARKAAWTGKHAPHQIIGLDEADGIPDLFHEAIATCLTGDDEHLLCTLNPKVPAGQIYEWHRKGAASIIQISAFDTPNVISGRNAVPGMASRDATVLDILTRSRPLAPDEARDRRAFEVPAFLDGCYATNEYGKRVGPLRAGWRVSREDYLDYKVLGRYPGGGANRLASDDEIDAARSRWDAHVLAYGEKVQGIRPIAGLDVSEGLEGDWNVFVARSGDFLHRSTRFGGIDSNQAGLWAALEMQTHNPPCRVLVVDDIGLGQSARTAAQNGGFLGEDHEEPLAVKGLGKSRVVAFKSSQRAESQVAEGRFFDRRCELLWAFAGWIKNQGMLPPNGRLLEELRTLLWYVDDRGLLRVTDKDTIRAKIGRSPDDLDAAKMTFAPVKTVATCSPLASARSIPL